MGNKTNKRLEDFIERTNQIKNDFISDKNSLISNLTENKDTNQVEVNNDNKIFNNVLNSEFFSKEKMEDIIKKIKEREI